MNILKKLNIVGLFLLINLGLFGQNNPIFIGDNKPQKKIVYATVNPEEILRVDSAEAEKKRIDRLIELANLDAKRREKDFVALGGQIISVPQTITVNGSDIAKKIATYNQEEEANFRKNVIFDFKIHHNNPLNLFRSHLNDGPYDVGDILNEVLPTIGTIGNSNGFFSLFNTNNLDSLNKIIHTRNKYLNKFNFGLEEMTFHKIIENDSYYLNCHNLYSIILPTNEKFFIILSHDSPVGSDLMEVLDSKIDFDMNSVGFSFSYLDNQYNMSKHNPTMAIYSLNNTLTPTEKDYRIQALVLSIAQRMYQEENYDKLCQLLGLDNIQTMNPLLKAIITNSNMNYQEILAYLESLSYSDDSSLIRLFQGENSYQILQEFIINNTPSLFRVYIEAKLQVSSK